MYRKNYGGDLSRESREWSEIPAGSGLVYAWNPTVLTSFALCGHHDSLAILTLLAANVWMLAHKRAVAIAFLALSFLAKFFPLILLPAFLQKPDRAGTTLRTAPAFARDRVPAWLGATLFAGVAFLGYVPYLGGGGNLFQGLSDYAAGWEANDSAFRLILGAGNSKGQAELVASVMLLALVAYALGRIGRLPATPADIGKPVLGAAQAE